MEQNNYLIPLSIIVAGVLVAGGIFLNKNSNGNPNDNGNGDINTEDITINPITEKDHILGNPDADILVVEYSDLECPFCKDFHNVMHEIIDKYGKDGQVAWVFRHFPLSTIHSKAPLESLAAECAADQGGNTAFWDYIDRIFEITPSNNGLNLNKLPEVAEEIGLDRDEFQACLDSGDLSQIVQEDFNDARKAGGQGTPYSVVITKSGEKIAVPGSLPFSSIDGLIQQLLEIESTNQANTQ